MKTTQLLIGNKIEIIETKNKSFKQISGMIIDKTKNLLIIETNKGIKKLIKNQIKFRIKNER